MKCHVIFSLFMVVGVKRNKQHIAFCGSLYSWFASECCTSSSLQIQEGYVSPHLLSLLENQNLILKQYLHYLQRVKTRSRQWRKAIKKPSSKTRPRYVEADLQNTDYL